MYIIAFVIGFVGGFIQMRNFNDALAVGIGMLILAVTLKRIFTRRY